MASKNKAFINDDFLLHGDFAKRLYHDHVKHQPIIDYHNHLPPQVIAENKNFPHITAPWLDGDHYKWRAMRTLGVSEHFITGRASAKEKFDKWAEAVPHTMRNPLYHWTHLELKRYFGIDELLNPTSSKSIYEQCNAQLQKDSHRPQQLLDMMNVELVCTTDDPIDDLTHHTAHEKSGSPLKMLPTFRPDKAYALDNIPAYLEYLEKLGDVNGVDIKSYDDLLEALSLRLQYFHDRGCRLSDHGLNTIVYYETGTFDTKNVFKKILDSKPLGFEEKEYLKFELLKYLGRKYHKMGWVQQFHLGALRSVNSRLLKQLGPDTGFDSIGDQRQAEGLGKHLDHLDKTDQLTKTILYNLNPADNAVMATMIGNFNDGTIKGKVQWGSGWWFLDQKNGMEEQLNMLSNVGLVSCFVGMLTDSRSLLSFPRHEYFRRILCNLIGNDVDRGELPADEKWLGNMMSSICYGNAKEYFAF